MQEGSYYKNNSKAYVNLEKQHCSKRYFFLHSNILGGIISEFSTATSKEKIPLQYPPVSQYLK